NIGHLLRKKLRLHAFFFLSIDHPRDELNFLEEQKKSCAKFPTVERLDKREQERMHQCLKGLAKAREGEFVAEVFQFFCEFIVIRADGTAPHRRDYFVPTE